MSENKYLIIGARMPEGSNDNPGGVMTATTNLLEYSKQNNIDVDLLNVYSPSFPPPPNIKKIFRFVKRCFRVWKMAKYNNYKSALIFSSSGLGFIERVFLASILEYYKTSTILYQVSGHFMDKVNKSKFFAYIAKKLLKIPTYIGAQGTQWISFYAQINIPKEKVKLIPNWLSNDIEFPLKALEIPMSPEEVKFIYVGWLVRKKGVYDLLEAIKCSTLLQKCQFQLVGGGTEEQSISQIIQEEKLNNIRLTGWLDHKQVMNEIRKANVLVFPSHTEGFPNSLIEAMSQGLAVVATTVGAIPDAVKENINGYLVNPGCPIELREKLEKIVLKYDEISVMGQNSMSIVKRDYSYSTNCKNVFTLLENV